MSEWLDLVEELAIGSCGVSAAEFDAMTPREIQWRIEAMVEQDTKALKRFAQLACWVMGPLTGKTLTVNDLVPSVSDQPRTFHF